jgi:hypothetical protein
VRACEEGLTCQGEERVKLIQVYGGGGRVESKQSPEQKQGENVDSDGNWAEPCNVIHTE